MFRVGQRVVYIEKTMPDVGLVKNDIYEVQTIEFCCEQTIDIGLTHNGTYGYCSDCGVIINIDERLFLSHTGFRALLPSEERKLEIESHAEAFNLTLLRDHKCY